MEPEDIQEETKDTTTYGSLRLAWEKFRDYCYLVQDSKFFNNLTIAMIVMNAIVLAIIW
jgi:hypothetical protein